MELEFGSVSFWEEGKTLYPPQRFPMGIPISISNNGKTESAQGTMGRGKRWEKASLLCFPFPSCLAGSFFFFPPSLSSSTQRGFCGGERGKPAEKHIVWAGMKSRNDRWRLHPGSKPGVLHKEVTIGSFQLGYNFVVASFVFGDLLNWISSATAREHQSVLFTLASGLRAEKTKWPGRREMGPRWKRGCGFVWVLLSCLLSE